MITSACGTGTARASIMRPQVPRESRARSQPHGLHHRQSSVKSAEKGGSHRQPRLRCRPDQGQEAACSGRYARLAAARHRRRRNGGLALLATLFGLNCSPTAPIARSFTAPWQPSCPPREDRQAIRSGDLRRPALGGRTQSPGSTAAADWPRTGRTSTATRSPSSSSRPFDSCSENSVHPT